LLKEDMKDLADSLQTWQNMFGVIIGLALWWQHFWLGLGLAD